MSAFPYQRLLLIRQIVPRLENRYAILLRIPDKLVLEPAHLLPSPAGDGTVVDALALVRNHEILADANYLSETSAHRACPEGTVEAEHIFVRLSESHPVRFEPVDKLP